MSPLSFKQEFCVFIKWLDVTVCSGILSILARVCWKYWGRLCCPSFSRAPGLYVLRCLSAGSSARAGQTHAHWCFPWCSTSSFTTETHKPTLQTEVSISYWWCQCKHTQIHCFWKPLHIYARNESTHEFTSCIAFKQASVKLHMIKSRANILWCITYTFINSYLINFIFWYLYTPFSILSW